MDRNKEKIKETLERKFQLVKDNRHLKQYYSAIVDYHIFVCDSLIIGPLIKQLVEEERIAPIYLKEIFNDYILEQFLAFDLKVPRIKHKFPSFYTNEIEQKYKLLHYFFDLVKEDYEDYKKHPEYLMINVNTPVIKVVRDDEFFHTNKLHNDILEKLDFQEQETKFSVEFDVGKSILKIDSKEVKFRKLSEQFHTLRIMFADNKLLGKEWFFSEIAELIDKYKGYTDKDFHNYFSAIKRRVASETGIRDLFITTTQSVEINQKYIKKI